MTADNTNVLHRRPTTLLTAKETPTHYTSQSGLCLKIKSHHREMKVLHFLCFLLRAEEVLLRCCGGGALQTLGARCFWELTAGCWVWLFFPGLESRAGRIYEKEDVTEVQDTAAQSVEKTFLDWKRLFVYNNNIPLSLTARTLGKGWFFFLEKKLIFKPVNIGLIYMLAVSKWAADGNYIWSCPLVVCIGRMTTLFDLGAH